MAAHIKTELLTICNNLGFVDDHRQYRKDPDCLRCLKEILRHLGRDNRQFLVRRILGETKIVITDLMPLIKQHCVEDETFFDIVLRLVLNLTTPPLILFHEEQPDTVDGKQLYLELLSYLYDYKMAFSTDIKFFSVLAKHMTKILQLDEFQIQEEHRSMMGRILLLIRNILHVPTDSTFEKVSDDDKNAHDRCLERLQDSGINELLLLMANAPDCRRYNFHLLEIISLMFKEQNAEFLARSVDPNALNTSMTKRNYFERQRESENLKELLTMEKKNKMTSSCLSYNRFKGATYVVQNLKSLSDQDLIYHKTPSNLDSIDFDSNKKRVRKPKNRAPIQDDNCATIASSETHMHKSTPLIRRYLYDFCKGFIADSYPTFMAEIRSDLGSQHSLSNDETYYLWASQFFMEFNRCSKGDINNVRITLSIESFHYLHTQIMKYSEHLELEKKKHHVWSRRLHYALKAYKELLYSLAVLETYVNLELHELAQQMKSTVFYEFEYRELIMDLLGRFNPIKMSMSYLKDLVETNHLFLKLLEHYCRHSDKVVVKQKKRNVGKRKKKSKEVENTEPPETIWTEILEELSNAAQGTLDLSTVEENEEVIKFDSASEKPTDEQKLDIMLRIHTLLKDKKPTAALVLYRNARTAWLESGDNPFGNSEITSEEEITNLNLILFDETLKQQGEEAVAIAAEEEDKDDDGLDDTESKSKTKEAELNFQDFLRKYVHPKIVTPYCRLLGQFNCNSSTTNKCVLKFLHRIAIDLKMHALLFQISVFQSFQKILACPVKDSEDLKELTRFIRYIMSRFVKVAQRNSKILVELFFWKNAREAYEVEEGYGTFETKTKSKRKPRADPEEFMGTIEDVIQQFRKDQSSEDEDEVERVNGGDTTAWESQENEMPEHDSNAMLNENLNMTDSDADSDAEAIPEITHESLDQPLHEPTGGASGDSDEEIVINKRRMVNKNRSLADSDVDSDAETIAGTEQKSFDQSSNQPADGGCEDSDEDIVKRRRRIVNKNLNLSDSDADSDAEAIPEATHESIEPPLNQPANDESEDSDEDIVERKRRKSWLESGNPKKIKNYSKDLGKGPSTKATVKRAHVMDFIKSNKSHLFRKMGLIADSDDEESNQNNTNHQ